MKQPVGQKWRPDFWFSVKFGVIVFMCLFIVYPFYTILTKSVFSDKVEGLTLYNFSRFFSKPYYYRPLIRSLVVCTMTVLTSTLIGVPIAYLMTRYNIPGKTLVHILIIMSLMSPPFIGAYSWIVLLGRIQPYKIPHPLGDLALMINLYPISINPAHTLRPS